MAPGVDIPIMLSECWRNHIPLGCAMQWRCVDTLDIVRAVGLGTVGGCGKLQCLRRHMQATDSVLTAHRALDDCYALRAVVQSVAELQCMTRWALVRKFSVSMDVAATSANLAVLI